MPTYEYFCKKCNKNFELVQKISEPPLEACPTCSGKVKRLLSAPAFALKGSGWYKDGYSSSSSSAKKSSVKSTETKKVESKKDK